MRTAIYEGHLDRGCNAYGACERNIIALSIRNRAQPRPGRVLPEAPRLLISGGLSGGFLQGVTVQHLG